MRTLKDELKELQSLLKNPTKENETLFQKKVLAIKQKHTTQKDANILGDFILQGYADINSSLNDIEKRMSQLRLAHCHPERSRKISFLYNKRIKRFFDFAQNDREYKR